MLEPGGKRVGGSNSGDRSDPGRFRRRAIRTRDTAVIGPVRGAARNLCTNLFAGQSVGRPGSDGGKPSRVPLPPIAACTNRMEDALAVQLPPSLLNGYPEQA